MPDVVVDLKEIEATINEFQKKLDRLKILYEQYFMGIEKREPLVPLKEVVRIMRYLDALKIRNTGLKFRLRSLVQKFNTYRTYWTRTNRAIENGTYHRDLARVRRKMQYKGIHMPTVGKLRTVGDVERAMTNAAIEEKHKETKKNPVVANPLDSIRGTSSDQLQQNIEPEPLLGPINLEEEDNQTKKTEKHPPSFCPGDIDPIEPIPGHNAFDKSAFPASAPVKPHQTFPPSNPSSRPNLPQISPNVSSHGLSDQKLQSIYRRFVKAKQMCGEDTSRVKYDALVHSLSRQMPIIRKKYQGQEIDFQVVIRSGKAILKAIPKK